MIQGRLSSPVVASVYLNSSLLKGMNKEGGKVLVLGGLICRPVFQKKVKNFEKFSM